MATVEITSENYAFLQQHVYKESGIVLDASKQYLIEARLAPIARKEGVGNLNDLCNLLRCLQRTDLKKAVVEAMTTNETLFFRDLAPFDALRNHILPELRIRNAASKTLSIWSAAASTGQEAYSIAMILLESGFADWKIQILGTDLADNVLERARQGRYVQVEVNRGLPATSLVKYFEREGLEWRIKENLRKMVRFEQFDLRRPMSGKGPFDIVFCRNVLIYFDIDTKKRIVSELLRCLAPSGHLCLGAAESMLSLSSDFERIVLGQASFYRKPAK
jgi:chemotaxis protein methyltransferase CheR